MKRCGKPLTFEPGCRNNWHIHHGGGQILICVGGQGWYQEPGKDAHLSLAVPKEGSSNEWLEPVTDEEYSKLK